MQSNNSIIRKFTIVLLYLKFLEFINYTFKKLFFHVFAVFYKDLKLLNI